MKSVTDLFTNIQLYYDLEDSASINYVDKTLSNAKIQGWIDTLQKYRNGVYIDSNPALTTDANPNVAIQKLNTFTNYVDNAGVKDPNCPRDIWVFDE